MQPLQLLWEPLERGTKAVQPEPAVINISKYWNDVAVPDPTEQSRWLKRPPLLQSTEE